MSVRTLLFYDFNILENTEVSNNCSEMTSFNKNMYSELIPAAGFPKTLKRAAWEFGQAVTAVLFLKKQFT